MLIVQIFRKVLLIWFISIFKSEINCFDPFTKKQVGPFFEIVRSSLLWVEYRSHACLKLLLQFVLKGLNSLNHKRTGVFDWTVLHFDLLSVSLESKTCRNCYPFCFIPLLKLVFFRADKFVSLHIGLRGNFSTWVKANDWNFVFFVPSV